MHDTSPSAQNSPADVPAFTRSGVRTSPTSRPRLTRAAGRAGFAGLVLGALLGATLVPAAPAGAGEPVADAGPATVTTLETRDAGTAGRVLAGAHVAVRSAALVTGRAVQAGTYAGLDIGAADAGLALSSGSLRPAVPDTAGDVDFSSSSLLGPNVGLTTTGDLGGPGSALLEDTTGVSTYDAAELRLRVVPDGDVLTIAYRIGSEEYAAWADRDYVDAFGVYVDGALCSVVDGRPAGVASINPHHHADLFVSNLTPEGRPGGMGTEMNGVSTLLECSAAVTPGCEVTVTAAVADTVDGHLDSTLLLAAGGFRSAARSETAGDPDGAAAERPRRPVPWALHRAAGRSAVAAILAAAAARAGVAEEVAAWFRRGGARRSAQNDGRRASARVARGPVARGPVARGPVARGPVASGPVASGPVASGPVTSGPVA